jgi:hypothetical protein
MYKLGHEVDGEVVEHSHPPRFIRQIVAPGEPGRSRLVIGVPGGDPNVLGALAAHLVEPMVLLYVLHTPRGEGEAGRYESEEIDHAALRGFLDRHAAFLAGDGRFDLWVISSEGGALLAWDRHNLLHAYGPLEAFAATLPGLGFQEGELPPLGGHMHYYRSEFDEEAKAVLSAFDWFRKPLRPEDEQ